MDVPLKCGNCDRFGVKADKYRNHYWISCPHCGHEETITIPEYNTRRQTSKTEFNNNLNSFVSQFSQRVTGIKSAGYMKEDEKDLIKEAEEELLEQKFGDLAEFAKSELEKERKEIERKVNRSLRDIRRANPNWKIDRLLQEAEGQLGAGEIEKWRGLGWYDKFMKKGREGLREKDIVERRRKARKGLLGKLEYKKGKWAVNAVTLGILVTIGLAVYIFSGGGAGGVMLFIGFTFWGLYGFLPEPGDNQGLAAAKIASKFALFVFFTIAFYYSIWRFMGLVVALVGYFSLGYIKYDPSKPEESMASVFRLFASVWIAGAFWTLFDSMMLGAIAFAFLFIVPRPGPETAKGKFSITIGGVSDKFGPFDRVIFFIIMLFVLGGSGATSAIGLGFFSFDAGWGLTGSMALVFLVYWLLALAAGIFSDAEARPYMGALFILIAFVAFTFSGPGGMSVGEVMFGQWWPQLYETTATIIEPIGDSLAQLTSTFGAGFELLVNPVGAANKIAAGTYTIDPDTGVKGAYGVEIESVKATPIFPNKPYSLDVRIENKGAFEAKNVKVALDPYKELGVYEEKFWTPGAETITMAQLGFETSPDTGAVCGEQCVQDVGELEKANIELSTFMSGKDGIACPVIEQFAIRKKPVPLQVILKYTYEINSEIKLEVKSHEEWMNLVRLGKLKVFKKEQASLTNAPVRLNLDTPEQPLKEAKPVSIGFSLESAKRYGKVTGVDNVILEYPKEFELVENSCTKKPDKKEGGKLIWTGWDEETKTGFPYIVYCTFKLPKVDRSKTFLIKASSDYEFSEYMAVPKHVEFGGGCCGDDDCEKGHTCKELVEDQPGRCLPEGATTPTEQPVIIEYRGKADFCEKKMAGRVAGEKSEACKFAEGGCEIGKNQCEGIVGPGGLGELKCKKIGGADVPVCCYEDSEDDSRCRDEFLKWKAG